MQDEAALDAYTKKMASLFEQKESEDNWQKFDECVIRFTEMTITSSHYPSYIGFVKSRLKNALIQSVF
jgi:hypothetical protein